VDVFLAREPDQGRFSGAALLRYKDVYRDIAAGKITGLSIAGAYAREPQGRRIKHWALDEVSITDRPCRQPRTHVNRRRLRRAVDLAGTTYGQERVWPATSQVGERHGTAQRPHLLVSLPPCGHDPVKTGGQLRCRCVRSRLRL
jgi:hypothetical protein